MIANVAIPPHIKEALIEVEMASAPADIGRPYHQLLEWRRKQRLILPDVFGRLFFIAAYFAMFFFFQQHLGAFWQGALVGFAAALAVGVVGDMLGAMSTRSRVDTAIDRWRHAVPAMRDFPK